MRLKFDLLTSRKANSKREISSTLRQPARQYFAHTNDQLESNLTSK